MSLSPLTRLSPLEHLETVQQPGSPAASSVGPKGGFDGVIGQLLGAVNGSEAAAGEAIQSLAAGEIEDVHGVSLAVAQADLALRLAVEVRNRLQEAYQEITRLQL